MATDKFMLSHHISSTGDTTWLFSFVDSTLLPCLARKANLGRTLIIAEACGSHRTSEFVFRRRLIAVSQGPHRDARTSWQTHDSCVHGSFASLNFRLAVVLDGYIGQIAVTPK